MYSKAIKVKDIVFDFNIWVRFTQFYMKYTIEIGLNNQIVFIKNLIEGSVGIEHLFVKFKKNEYDFNTNKLVIKQEAQNPIIISIPDEVFT